VRVVDLDRYEVSRARMDGLAVHRGSVFADETWDALEMEHAACFVAMTENDELNVLASRYAAAIIGRQSVFQLVPRRAEHAAWWTLPPGIFARPLFGSDVTIDVMERHLSSGWKVTATLLTAQFGPDEYARVHPEAVVLFTRDGRNAIEIATADERPRLRSGTMVVALTAANGTGPQ
jgi:hypothetical protein